MPLLTTERKIMNYEEMSDGEITWRVHHIVKKIPEGYATMCVKDYCNNPGDAWPIMIENNISLHYEWHKKGKYTAIGTRWSERSLGHHGQSLEVTLDKGQELRAAMICFLEIKKTGQEND